MSINQIDISSKGFNEKYRYLLDSPERYLIVYGGAGSGKSYGIAQGIIREMLKSTCNCLIVRNTSKSNRDSTFALIRQVISSWGVTDEFKINISDMRISCDRVDENGFKVGRNELVFAGLDDVEKLKSITFADGIMTRIWIEEASEISEADFNQLDIRLRGKGVRKQIILSFNPIDVNHWIRRRFCIDPSEDTRIVHSTYKDNRFLDDEYIKLLEGFKETDPYYYNVYALGMWGVYSGTIFDANRINERLQALPSHIKKGNFLYSYDGLKITDIRWNEDSNGAITIYKEPQKMEYCIGGDTAGEGSDFFIGQVLDQNGNQVAVLRQQMDSDLYTKQIYCLGKYFNSALLTIEVNFDSYPIQELQRLGYTKMYIREVNDTALNKYRKSYGFRTDSWTRPAIINHLVEIVRDHVEFMNDRMTLEEMLTFIRNEKGRMEAANGAHDDLVMALAIAYEGMNQVRIRTPNPSPDYSDCEEDDRKKSFGDYWG